MQRPGLVMVAVIIVLVQGLVGLAIPDLRLCVRPMSAVSERVAPPCCQEGCPLPAMPAPEPADGCQCDKIPVREALVPLLSVMPAGTIVADLPSAPAIAMPWPSIHDGWMEADRRSRAPSHRHLVFLRSVVLTC